MLYEIQQASYTASRVWPKRKISCAAAQIAATLTISFPRWHHMSLTSYWGQQRMSLTSYPVHWYQSSWTNMKAVTGACKLIDGCSLELCLATFLVASSGIYHSNKVNLISDFCFNYKLYIYGRIVLFFSSAMVQILLFSICSTCLLTVLVVNTEVSSSNSIQVWYQLLKLSM